MNFMPQIHWEWKVIQGTDGMLPWLGTETSQCKTGYIVTVW